jgi:hypothetical protein
MATITSAQTGNFSDTATWVGGVVPTVGDIAVAANGHVVAIDTDVTLTRVTQLGTGKFTLGGGRTLTAEVQAVAGSFTSGGTVEVTATSGSTAYIVGNAVGPTGVGTNRAAVVVTGNGTLELTGNLRGGTGDASITTLGNENVAIYSNATSVIIINGNATGGAGVAAQAILLGVLFTGTLTIIGQVTGANTTAGADSYGLHIRGTPSVVAITGDVTGGAGASFSGQCRGISVLNTVGNFSITGNVSGGVANLAAGIFASAATFSVNVTGNVSGGTAANTHGISTTGANATITVTGDVTAGSGSGVNGIIGTGASTFVDVVGNATAGSASGHAIRSDATTAGFGVRLAGDMVDTQNGVCAVYTRFFRIVSTSPSGVTQYANDASFPTGGTVSRVSPDLVSGSAQPQDVRLGTTYGYNNELTGTLAVPPSQSVAFGVPVDNTFGVASLDADDLADSLVDILVGITENNGTITVPYNRGTETFTRAAVIDGSRTVQLIPNE